MEERSQKKQARRQAGRQTNKQTNKQASKQPFSKVVNGNIGQMCNSLCETCNDQREKR